MNTAPQSADMRTSWLIWRSVIADHTAGSRPPPSSLPSRPRTLYPIRQVDASPIRAWRGILRRVFEMSPPVTACARPSATLGAAPGGRMVARVIVERPVALGAGFEARPGPILLRCVRDRDQPADEIGRASCRERV